MSRVVLKFASVLLGVSAFVVACAGDEEEADPAKAAQDAFVADYCEIIKNCCANTLNQPEDGPGCRTRIAALDPAMVKDEKARNDCMIQIRAVTSQADFCTDFGSMNIPACPDLRRRANVGTLKIGEVCAADAECAPSFEGTIACSGVCQLTRRGKEGEGPCRLTIEGDLETKVNDKVDGPSAVSCYVKDGLYCDPDSKKCIRPKPVDSDCSEHSDCVPTAYCHPETEKCTIRLGGDNACTEDFQCQGLCKDKFCTSALEEGEKCDVNEECVTRLCEGGRCKRPTANTRLSQSCVTPGGVTPDAGTP